MTPRRRRPSATRCTPLAVFTKHQLYSMWHQLAAVLPHVLQSHAATLTSLGLTENSHRSPDDVHDVHNTWRAAEEHQFSESGPHQLTPVMVTMKWMNCLLLTFLVCFAANIYLFKCRTQYILSILSETVWQQQHQSLLIHKYALSCTTICNYRTWQREVTQPDDSFTHLRKEDVKRKQSHQWCRVCGIWENRR